MKWGGGFFPDVLKTIDYIAKLKDFHDYLIFQGIFAQDFQGLPNTGIYMIAVAIACGYEEIYITGIDFYENKMYPFRTDTKTYKKLKIMPKNMSHDTINLSKMLDKNGTGHTREANIESLKFIIKHYPHIKLYSISPNSPINNYIPLSPHNNIPTIDITEKPQDSIKDLCMPSKYTYELFNYNMLLEPPYTATAKYRLKNNFYFKLFFDLIKLPRIIIDYIKEKRGKCFY